VNPDILQRFLCFVAEELRLPEDDAEAIIALAEENLVSSFAKLDATLAVSDAAAAREAAHALKGSLRNMGLADLAQRVGELERGADEGSLQGCREILEELRRAVGPLRTAGLERNTI
jgi:HPt (histidine-containing phosphotransfer) domain-containing protein